MKKNKLIALCAAAVLSATAVVGGTLAYFTDTDDAVNTFTVGKVKIALNETITGKDMTNEEYQDWLKNQKLIPAVKNTDSNWIDKIVTVKNTGDQEAYLWAEIWIPAELDVKVDGWKVGGIVKKDVDNGRALHLDYDVNVNVKFNGVKKSDKTQYNSYIFYYKNPVVPDESTGNLLNAVYMDSAVEQCKNENHEKCWNLNNGTADYTGPWELKVYAYGIQSKGFNNIEEAMQNFPATDNKQ